MTPTRFWWIRHAVVPAGGKFYGQDDLAADCGDRESFIGLAQALPDDAVWVATSLQRTQQTARAIWAEQANPPGDFDHIEPDLIEQHFGDWQGRAIREVYAETTPAQRRFWVAPARQAPPGGESFVDLHARAAPAIDRLAERFAGRDVVIVAHGGTIRAALGHALALPPEAMLQFCAFNLSITRIDHFRADGDDPASWRVVAINQPPRTDAEDWAA